MTQRQEPGCSLGAQAPLRGRVSAAGREGVVRAVGRDGKGISPGARASPGGMGGAADAAGASRT